MTDIRCKCGESMDAYDNKEMRGRIENYFICHSCNNKKKQIIILNEQGAEIFNEIVGD